MASGVAKRLCVGEMVVIKNRKPVKMDHPRRRVLTTGEFCACGYVQWCPDCGALKVDGKRWRFPGWGTEKRKKAGQRTARMPLR